MNRAPFSLHQPLLDAFKELVEENPAVLERPMMGYGTRTIEMFLLGYCFQDMESYLIDCLAGICGGEFTREEAFEFAYAYDKEYGLKLVQKLH